MPSYIIIDRHTGYIFGDTRDFAPGLDMGTSPAEACRLLDESIGTYGRSYEEVPSLDQDHGYAVYRADIDGSEAVTVIHDGQDDDTIKAVQRDCRLEAYINWKNTGLD